MIDSREEYLTLVIVDQIEASSKAIRDLGGFELSKQVSEFARDVRHKVGHGQSLFEDNAE
ncbi:MULTISPECIES: hypothetical protein [Bacteria]|uniref:Uncharacterized protein n=2 Tax=Bacteria TaxID=2 RepID=A0A1I4UJW8_9BURK|nr:MULTISPECIES: hypothetical protein [Bacteria]SFE68788.1 hypothetical protein SAMN05216506_113157 [Saccharopolyspora kobensis]SFM89185.1 hypothetical protein SAMN02982985_05689 [Rugamonas rubra]